MLLRVADTIYLSIKWAELHTIIPGYRAGLKPMPPTTLKY